MIRVDHANRIFKYRSLALDQSIRRQTARRHPNAHRTARGMKAQPNHLRSLNGVVKSRTIRKKIQMIRTHRTARQRQFRQTDHCRDPHLIRTKARPDRIKRFEPAKQQGILTARHRAGQRLIKVMMRIHQPRGHNAGTSMNNLASRRQIGPNLGNHTTPHQNVRFHQFAARIVHRQNRFRRFNQNILHRHPLCF